MRQRIARLLGGLVLALGLLLLSPIVTSADSADPAQQCAADSTATGGIAMPWDLSCYAGVAENVTGAVADGAIGSLADWVTQGAQESTAVLLQSFTNDNTHPALGESWFEQLYYGGVAHDGQSGSPGTPGTMAIAMVLAVPLFTAAVLVLLMRGDAVGLLKLAVVRLPAAVLAGFAALFLIARLLDLVDLLSGWVMQGGTQSLSQWNNQLTHTNLGQDFLVVLTCLVIVLATLLCYVELFVRDAAMYIVIAFIPLIAVATLWPGARSALKRAAETIFVLAVSKFVMAFVLVLGSGLMTSSSVRGFYPLVAGAIVFVLAGTAPLSIFKLVPILEGAAAGAVAGTGAAWGRRGLRHGGRLVGGAAGAAAGGAGAAVGMLRAPLRSSGGEGGHTGEVTLVGRPSAASLLREQRGGDRAMTAPRSQASGEHSIVEVMGRAERDGRAVAPLVPPSGQLTMNDEGSLDG